jgi:hypothetical protein
LGAQGYERALDALANIIEREPGEVDR